MKKRKLSRWDREREQKRRERLAWRKRVNLLSRTLDRVCSDAAQEKQDGHYTVELKSRFLLLSARHAVAQALVRL